MLQSVPLYVDKELMILASLTNANVTHLYQYTRGRDDSFFFLMECIDGGSFDDIIEKTITLTISLIWSHLQQIVNALVYLQGEGVLHCDLKLENIMVTMSDRVKLIDFGLSKKLESHVKVAGSSKGTPTYIWVKRNCSEENTMVEMAFGRQALHWASYWA